MNTYFIFYKETKEVVALYQADAIDLGRYIVEQGPEIAHALAEVGVSPHACEIQDDGQGGFVAVSQVLS